MTEVGLRERKKLETRRTIHRAALRLVDEHGLGGATVDAIAQSAGISPRTFFNYYATKDAAVVGAAPDAGVRLAEALRAWPAEGDVREAVFGVLRARLTPFLDEGFRDRRARVMRSHPELITAMKTLVRGIEEAMAGVIAERTGTDPVHDVYPRMLAGACINAFVVAITLPAAEGRSPYDVFDEAAALIRSGYQPPHRGG